MSDRRCSRPSKSFLAAQAETPSRERLAAARVLIVGVGGLGSPAALYLAAAGIGMLGLVDGDAVELSNLHRQIIYRTQELKQGKVRAAAARIAGLNPRVAVECFEEPLSAVNLPAIFRRFDFVVDGTDRIATKYLVNDGAVLLGVPYSHAGIVGFQGQTLTVLPKRSACLRCIFPSPPPAGDVPTCQEAGIIGALAGSLGILQATEALKYVLGEGKLLTNRLLTYDGRAARWRSVPLARQRSCPLCGEAPTIRSLGPVANA